MHQAYSQIGGAYVNVADKKDEVRIASSVSELVGGRVEGQVCRE